MVNGQKSAWLGALSVGPDRDNNGLGLGKGKIAHNVGMVVRKEREYDG